MPPSLANRLADSIPLLVLRLAMVAVIGVTLGALIVAFGGSWNTASIWILRVCVPAGGLAVLVWIVGAAKEPQG